MKSKSSSSKKKGPFIPYIPPPQDTPPQEEFWFGDIQDMSNGPTAGSWSANPPAEESSIAVDAQLTTELYTTSKSFSKTVNTTTFL